MTALDSALNPDHFERPDALYSLVPEIADGALLGGTARQLAHGNEYPIERHTPGGVALTNANFAQSIRNAIAAAQLVAGGTILLPRGKWRPADVSPEEIVILGTGRDKNVVIAGAGMDETTIEYPTGYSGTAFFFKGSPGSPAASDLYWNGGMRDCTVQCESLDVSNDGVGIRVEACINTQFRNITIRNFVGGTSFKSTSYPPDYTNQYIQLWNFTASGGRVNFDLLSFVNCQGYGVFSTAAQYRDYLIDDSRATFFGGNIQSSPPTCVELAGNGASQIVFHDFYYEGFADNLFKCASPAVTASRLEVYGFHLGGNPDVLLDVDAFNDVCMHYTNRVGNAVVILKARNGPSVTLIGSGDPVSAPGKFDLDSASLATLVCVSNSTTVCPSMSAHTDVTAKRRLIADLAVALPGFATDSEGVGVQGDLARDTSRDRPTFRTAAVWQRVAFSLDDDDLSAILAPFAVEIFDPGVYRTRTVIADELDVLLGVMHGSSLAAPASDQRPGFTLSDEFFGGRPSLTCAFTDDHYLIGSLATTVPSSSRAGLFAVYRCLPGTNDASKRRLAIIAEHGSDHANGLGLGQSDLNASNQAYGYISGPGGLGFPVGATGTDGFGHASTIYSIPGASLYYRDDEAISTSIDAGANTSAIDKVALGAGWNGAEYVGCNVVVAYAAVLKQPLDSDTRVRALRAALSRYSLR